VAEIKRNLQTEGGIYIDKWWTGLYKNRSPLFTPVSALGITIVGRRDALIDGLNMMVTPQYSMRRRYGNSKACSVAFNPGEFPLGYFSFQNLAGALFDLVDTQTNVYTFTPSSKTSIYTKTAGAGQSSFVSVLNWVYWVDGKVAKKFDGTNVWNMGIVAPAIAPTIVTTETGQQAVGVPWEPVAWYSTMGLLVDSNGNMQQLIQVNNPTPTAPYTSDYGTSTPTNGQPPFSHTSGATITDGTVTWKCEGPLATYDFFGSFYKYYLDTSFYGNGTQAIIPGYLWDEVHGILYAQIFNPGAGVAVPAGPPRPNFTGQPFQQVIANFCTFYDFNGAGATPKAWQASHPYATTLNNGDVYVYEPAVPPYSNQTPVFLQRCIVAGTSADGSTYTLNWSTATGATTDDNQLKWVNLGSATRQNSHPYTAWTSATNYTFSAIKDANGNIQVCVVSGISAGSAPTFNTNYGQQTTDGTVTWVCVGRDTGWIKNQIYYLPKSGFAPPFNVGFGGAAILDTVTNTVQYVSNTGVSGSSKPSFSGTTGVQTLDGSGGTQITWVCNGAPLSQGLSWNFGYAYAYSYKARTATDFYSVASVGPNGGPAVIPTPPGLIGQIGIGYTGGGLPAPTGSKSGQISTASPVTLITTSNPGAQNTLTITGSTDPQVDTIVIWRSKDGGGAANMFELTEIPNPPVTNGIAGTVKFVDFQPDSVLNTQIIAPIAHANDPIPSSVAGFPTGASILVWYGGRLWAAVGNTLYFSAGPDAFATSGVGTESWPPGNNFPLPGNITNLIATSTGLIISVLDNAYVTTGTTSSTFTVPLLWQKNFGVPSINASDQDGDNVFFFTTKGQVWHFSANGLENIGDLNAVDFGAMTPANVYVSVHRSGVDEGVFVSDGVSNIWRYSTKSQSWDTPMGIVNGCGAIGSIETSVGNWQLLVGRNVGSGFILKRDLTLYTDDTLAYHAFMTVGSLVVAPPRQTVVIQSILLQTKAIGTIPSVKVLLNEVSDTGNFPATFVPLPNPVNDPWELLPTQTLFQKRYDLKANTIGPLPQTVQHMQVLIDFGSDTVANELLGLGLA
jgi:hypothetical protein